MAEQQKVKTLLEEVRERMQFALDQHESGLTEYEVDYNVPDVFGAIYRLYVELGEVERLEGSLPGGVSITVAQEAV